MNSTNELFLKISNIFRSACLSELEALKPGNVHIFADGHGMVIEDFIKSAEASSIAIAAEGLSVGERIYQAVKATHHAVGMNTNLGIVLLCAPLVHAAYHKNKLDSFEETLMRILQHLTVADAQLTAQAILLANPAGLGNSVHGDVNNSPQVTLLELMKIAQDRDRIAWQYANTYADIFNFGLPLYQKALDKYQNEARATTALYLGYLSNQADTHIVRKYGQAVAEEVMIEAQNFETIFWATDNPKLIQHQLLNWDLSLKNRQLNPGTCADLTVATVFLKLIS